MDPFGGYNPLQPGDDFTTSYRPLPPLPAHLHRIYHSNPPSPDPATRPISSAGSTPAGDSDKASPNLNGNPLAAAAASGSANNSAKKRDRGRAAERSEEGSSRVPSPANGAAAGQDDGTPKDGKAPAKRAKVKVGARASIACICCRKRKVRCSGEWPTCKFCEGRNMTCVYEGHPAENGGPTNPVSAAFGVGALLSPSIDPILPPEGVILAAMDIFFLHNYDTFYFLHRPTLIESVKNGSAPKELVCCILAFAARFSQPLRELHPSSPTAASEHYAALAAQVLANPSSASAAASTSSQPASHPEISLTRCQCFLMLGLYECTASLENKGWLKIGYAIRMAQVLRLGFEDEDEGAGTRAPKDPLRSEIRRRTFWACFLLDRTVSDGKERPCSLKPPLPSALRMPSSDADFLASRPSQGARFDPDPPKWSLSAKSESEGKGPEADLYGLTLRVAEIWQRVATYIGSGGRNIDRRAPWLPESTFATLQRDLTTFDERLPAEQKYSEANLLAHNLIGQGRLFGMLHLLFSTSRLVLHRDYLPFLPPPNFKAGDGPVDGEPLCGEPAAPAGWWQTSFNHAAQASGTVADILGSTAGHGAMITHPFAGFAALASLTIHLHLKYWPQSSDTPVNNAFHIEQTTSILTALRDVYPIAAGWCDGMAKLQLLYYNLVRGVLDVDPAKVRASVVQLLRTVKEEDHGHSPTRPPVFTTTNTLPHLASASNPTGPHLLNSLNTDVFAPPFPRTSSAPHNPALGAPAVASPLDLNTEFDFLLPAPGMDPFDLWGTGANGGWADLSLLSSVDSTWGMGGPAMWPHPGAAHPGQYYG